VRSLMNRKLDVGNLSPTTDLRELRELFSQAGQVAALTVVRDGISGRVQRLAYLEMESHDGAQAAVARFDQYPFRGQMLTVSERRPDALADEDQHLSSRHAAATLLKERECGDHSNAGCRDMLDEGAPLRAGD
jgi:RNA recognition motif-containing protein